MESLFWQIFLANCLITVTSTIFAFMRMKQNRDKKDAGVGILGWSLFVVFLMWLIWLRSVT